MLLVLGLVPVLKQQSDTFINGNIREINIKNGTYKFFYDIINVEDFESNLLKINKKSCKNIGIYNIEYITIKKI